MLLLWLLTTTFPRLLDKVCILAAGDLIPMNPDCEVIEGCLYKNMCFCSCNTAEEGYVGIVAVLISTNESLHEIPLVILKLATGDLHVLTVVDINDDIHCKENMSNYVVIDVPADGLSWLGVRTSAVMFGCRTCNETVFAIHVLRVCLKYWGRFAPPHLVPHKFKVTKGHCWFLRVI